jgi:hypothetical protein
MATLRHISPFAVDLALSRLSLAALKVRDRIPLDDTDRAAATELREVLRRDQGMLKDPQPIRADVVPQTEMRNGLEKTLATLPRPTTTNLLPDLPSVERLLHLTSELADRGTLPPALADEMLVILNRIERSREQKRSQPDLGVLRGL